MHNTATRSSLLRLLRLSQPMLQLILSTLHRLPQCLLPLHPLMLRIDVSFEAVSSWIERRVPAINTT